MPEPAGPRWPAPVKGKAAEVDPAAWTLYADMRRLLEEYEAIAQVAEDNVREQIGDAQVITVGGVKVAVRIVQHVKDASWTKDYFRRVPGTTA